MRAILAALLCLSCARPDSQGPRSEITIEPPAASNVRWVDPFIGTGEASAAGPLAKRGATFPGATAPFGMVAFSPDTIGAPGYAHEDDLIAAFSLTHVSGVGCAAARDFPIVPWVGDLTHAVLDYPTLRFRHDTETAWPGFYEVTTEEGIKVDLTASVRAGLARFTFPRGADAKIVLMHGVIRDVLSTVDFQARADGPNTVVATRTFGGFCDEENQYTIHMAAEFDRPWQTQGRLIDGTIEPAHMTSGLAGHLFFGFDTEEDPVVEMRIGLSYVSQEKALANLRAEIPEWDFDAIRDRTTAAWTDHLARIEVEGGTDEQRTMFYTALYHSLLAPTVFTDVDGEYTGFDRTVHRTDRTRYATFSGWDVYRSWIQLVSILAPAETSDMMQSLVATADECGALPKWSLANSETSVMLGDPSDLILANAWAFGARDFDASAALAHMVHAATQPGSGCQGRVSRNGLRHYLERNYCAPDGDDRVLFAPAVTLEYATADFAIAQMARALNEVEIERDFLARSSNWRMTFDDTHEARGFRGYVLPRSSVDVDGRPVFLESGVEMSNDHYAEGNATQYTFMVMHDLYGLSEALGGDAIMRARLDNLFTEINAGSDRPYFYMGNEVQFGTPWEYPFVGAPWRTQEVVRKIVLGSFDATPSGVPGNDDLGATSSWLVWAMLGLYPAVPGVGGFVIGSPIFERATIALGDGTLTVIGRNASASTPYVTALSLDGTPLETTWIAWDRISRGGTLEFTLSDAPDESWATSHDARPPRR